MESTTTSWNTDRNRQLVLELSEGKKNALKQIYDEFYQMLFSLSYQYVNDYEEAREAVQNAFVKLWENRDLMKESTNLKNFLYTIVKNNSLNYLKKQEIIMRSNEDLKWMEMHYHYESMMRLGNDEFEFDELRKQVEDAIERLPEQCRLVFKMSRFDDLRNKEIAEKLNVSEKTVEAHITKALKSLRKDLSPYMSIIMAISDIFV
ncbi:MAG: RNA polymerase sigma-70 factor [Carboxylicivirga sp.]|nr:RNA polymerase sigma-70 factor [Carboxylicivirga sp.]